MQAQFLRPRDPRADISHAETAVAALVWSSRERGRMRIIWHKNNFNNFSNFRKVNHFIVFALQSPNQSNHRFLLPLLS